MSSEDFADVTTVNISNTSVLTLTSKVVDDGVGVITLTGVAAGTVSVSVNYTDSVGVIHKRVFRITVRGEQPQPSELSFTWSPTNGNMNYTTLNPASGSVSVGNLPEGMTTEQFAQAVSLTFGNNKLETYGSPIVLNGVGYVNFRTSSSVTDGECVATVSVTIDGVAQTDTKTFTCTDATVNITFTATAGTVNMGDDWEFSVNGIPTDLTSSDFTVSLSQTAQLFQTPRLISLDNGTAVYKAEAFPVMADTTGDVQIAFTMFNPFQQVTSSAYAMTVAVPPIQINGFVTDEATTDCVGLGLGSINIQGIPVDATLSEVLSVTSNDTDSVNYTISDTTVPDPIDPSVTNRIVTVSVVVGSSPSVGLCPISVAVTHEGTTYRKTYGCTFSAPTYGANDIAIVQQSMPYGSFGAFTLELENVDATAYPDVTTMNIQAVASIYDSVRETTTALSIVGTPAMSIVGGGRGVIMNFNPDTPLTDIVTAGQISVALTFSDASSNTHNLSTTIVISST